MASAYTLRYVVLHHVGIERPHFDLLYETANGSELSAYRLSEWPVTRDTAVSPGDTHRRIYLDYQGPISDGRGSVQRVAAGLCMMRVDDRLADLILDSGEKFSRSNA